MFISPNSSGRQPIQQEGAHHDPQLIQRVGQGGSKAVANRITRAERPITVVPERLLERTAVSRLWLRQLTIEGAQHHAV